MTRGLVTIVDSATVLKFAAAISAGAAQYR